MRSPTVSVIVPNYDHARLLRQRIDSILGQTFQGFGVALDL
jgi:glycosyltransferase involved in cell wall biosynthesis